MFLILTVTSATSGDTSTDSPAVNAQAKSFRQAAEWEVGNLTKGAPRLLDKFKVSRDGDMSQLHYTTSSDLHLNLIPIQQNHPLQVYPLPL